jgi:hypothetical protein
MENLIQVSCDERIRIQNSCYVLKSIADSFYFTGNEAMAQKLTTIANEIEESINKIDKAVVGALNSAFKQSEESSFNLFQAALAGVTLATEGKHGTVKKNKE